MKSRTALLTALVCLATAAPAPSQQTATVQRVQLTEKIHRFTLTGGYEVSALASIGEDGVLLVDTGFAETAPELAAALDELGAGPVRIVINTHEHTDHVGGNALLGESATIYAHHRTPQRLREGGRLLAQLPEETFPDVLIDEPTTLHFNGEDIEIRPVPATHTDNDLVVLFTGSKVAYLGDVGYGSHFPSIGYRIGNASAYADVVAGLLQWLPRDVTTVSGHGEDLDYAGLVAYQEMLSETIAIVARGLDYGLTPEQMKERRVLVDWESHAGPYVSADDWIDAIVRGLRVPPKPSLIDPLYHAYQRGGGDEVLATYVRLWNEEPDTYMFEGVEIRAVAVHLLTVEQDPAAAARLLEQLAVHLPGNSSFHRWASEVWIAAGDNERARANVRRALQVDPDDEIAQRMLRDLGGGRIAFYSNRSGADYEIHSMRPDGSDLLQLTDNDAHDLCPDWSPDGRMIVFHSDRVDPNPVACQRDCRTDLFVMNAGGGEARRLTTDGRSRLGDWSPDGSRIAYSSYVDDNWEVFVIDAAGSDARRLTFTRGNESHVRWSPDGHRLAFTREDAGIHQLFVMASDGGETTQLTAGPRWGVYPRWAPDGGRLAYFSYDPKTRDADILALEADGSDLRTIAGGSTRDEDPSWSPDGSALAFHSNRDGNYEIYAVDADGGNQRRLTNDPAGDYWPDWSVEPSRVPAVSTNDTSAGGRARRAPLDRLR